MLSDQVVTGKTIYDKCNQRLINSLEAIQELYQVIIEGFMNEKRKKLAKTSKEVKKLNKEIKSFKNNAHEMVLRLQEKEPAETGEYYVQMLDYLREMAHCMTYIADPVFDHIDNNHEPLASADAEDLKKYLHSFQEYLSRCIKVIHSKKFEEIDRLNGLMQALLDELAKMRKNHLKRIKADGISTRVSMLYLDVMAESKNLVLFIINLVKTSRDFSISANRILKS